MPIMHGKGDFAKIKGSICYIPIEAANICNILPRPAYSKRINCDEIKKDLKYRGYVYFELVRPIVIYRALNYLKIRNKFWGNFHFRRPLKQRSYKFFRYWWTLGWAESIHKKIISNATECGSGEDPLSMHRTASNETVPVSEISYIINDENVIIAPGQGKKHV